MSCLFQLIDTRHRVLVAMQQWVFRSLKTELSEKSSLELAVAYMQLWALKG